MALFRMDRAYAWTPEMLIAQGSIAITAALSLTTVNEQINPALIGLGIGLPNPGTSSLSATETVSPLGARGNVFLNPNGSVAAAAGNNNALPAGMAAGQTGTLGSELMIDFSAFDADILSAMAALRTNTRGAQARTAVVSAVDNINKLVYIQIQSDAGTAASLVAGDVVSFNVAFKDTFSI